MSMTATATKKKQKRKKKTREVLPHFFFSSLGQRREEEMKEKQVERWISVKEHTQRLNTEQEENKQTYACYLYCFDFSFSRTSIHAESRSSKDHH